MLEDSIIYVGDKICAKVGSSPPIDQVVNIECIDANKQVFKDDTSGSDINAGVKGKFIEIKSKYNNQAGVFTICDLTVIAKEKD